MTDLSTSYLGLSLPSPLVAPVNRELSMIT